MLNPDELTTARPGVSDQLPDPWGVCDVCGEAAGLPDPDAHIAIYLCAGCATERALMNSAQHDLEALTGPMIGAWAAKWTAAGLNTEQLNEVMEWASGVWMHHTAALAFRLRALRFLRRRHPVPPLPAPCPPARHTFALDDLPRVTAYHPADGNSRPTFEMGDRQPRTLPRGLDTLILEEADGSRTVIFVGYAGRLDVDTAWAVGPRGYRVPAALWPAFQAALSREVKDLPSFAVQPTGQS